MYKNVGYINVHKFLEKMVSNRQLHKESVIVVVQDENIVHNN